MKNTIQNILRFYRDCYQFEYSTEKVSSFYASAVTNLYYPSTFKILSRLEYELPVDTDWGVKIATELKLASSEKKLISGTFFLKGKMEILGKQHRIFTPLFLHDVTLSHSNDVYFLKVEQESISLNPIAVNYLNSLEENLIHQYDDLSTSILDGTNLFSFSGLFRLHNLLKEKYPTLNSDLLDKRIETEERICNLDEFYKSRKVEYENTLFPDILIGLIEKFKKSKDVINELNDLSEREHDGSSILTNIFLDHDFEKPLQRTTPIKPEIVVPVSLSQSQEKIITALHQSKVSVVIGPPGTGKSFSIAALAIQALQEGKKVLIASKNEQACQVLYHKIHNEIGIKGVTVNASKPRYRTTVATRLRNISNGIGLNSVRDEYYIKVKNKVTSLNKKTRSIIDEITSREAIEKKWGEKLANTSGNLFLKIQKKWIEYQHGKNEPIWQLKYYLHEYDLELKKKEKQLIKLTYQRNLNQLLKNSRPELLRYEKAFQETRGNVIKDIFSSVNFNLVLEALPIWICRSMDVANIVPLESGLFDLLIIDEASQCDISSSIPLIYRAKSTVIVGDPNQLRHLSFISKHKEKITKTKYDLNDLDINYRDRSILDQVNQSIKSQDNIIFLDEHFRSVPDIINFSNHQFYSGQLKIMTEHFNEGDNDNLKVHIVKDGRRNQKGENRVEADCIVEAIKEIIEAEESLGRTNCSTIGIISPFRFQVQLISKIVKEKIDLSGIKKHKILIGTPFKFQGEERDIVFLSFTIDEDTHPSSIRYLEKPDVFNVSITRAKYKQEVFISIHPNKLKKDKLLAKYLSSPSPVQEQIVERTAYDEFLEEVKQNLEEFNSGKILVNKKICGTNLDLVIIQKHQTLGIDLIGHPGTYKDQLTINELNSLERAKIDVFLLPYSTWHFDKDSCLKALARFVEY